MIRHLAGTGLAGVGVVLLLGSAQAHAGSDGHWSGSFGSSAQFSPAPSPFPAHPYPPSGRQSEQFEQSGRHFIPQPPPAGAMPPPVTITPQSQFAYGAPPSAFAPIPPGQNWSPPSIPPCFPNCGWHDGWRERHGGFDRRDGFDHRDGPLEWQQR